jgi:hypothetical protein
MGNLRKLRAAAGSYRIIKIMGIIGIFGIISIIGIIGERRSAP